MALILLLLLGRPRRARGRRLRGAAGGRRWRREQRRPLRRAFRTRNGGNNSLHMHTHTAARTLRTPYGERRVPPPPLVAPAEPPGSEAAWAGADSAGSARPMMGAAAPLPITAPLRIRRSGARYTTGSAIPPVVPRGACLSDAARCSAAPDGVRSHARTVPVEDTLPQATAPRHGAQTPRYATRSVCNIQLVATARLCRVRRPPAPVSRPVQPT